ncbi:Hypothetical predicted protein, partial [Pelobates cultripes]
PPPNYTPYFSPLYPNLSPKNDDDLVLAVAVGSQRIATAPSSSLSPQDEKVKQIQRRSPKGIQTRYKKKMGLGVKRTDKDDGEEEGEEEFDELDTQQTYPFLTVGDQLILKPLTPGELKDIIKGAPNPRTNPSACIMYLKRMCQGQNMTQIDIKLIIDGLLDYDSESGWEWNRVTTVSVPLDGTT